MVNLNRLLFVALLASINPLSSFTIAQQPAEIGSSLKERIAARGDPKAGGTREASASELETKRVSNETSVDGAVDKVEIVTGFDCASAIKVEQSTSNHFIVTVATKAPILNWVMFKVHGAKGQVVRFDLRGMRVDKWSTFNPVFCNAASIEELSVYQSANKQGNSIRALNGAILPDTSGQQWKYIPDVWLENKSVCFVHAFTEDDVWIAMRPPYTNQYHHNYMEELKKRPSVKVNEVGKSGQGKTLSVVQIGDGDLTKTPCVVLCARTHSSDQDTSWLVQGAIDLMSGDSPEAVELRKRVTLIAIPMLDPDAAAVGQFAGSGAEFVPFDQSSVESMAFADFFRKWIVAGNRLDITFDFYQWESNEGMHISVPGIDNNPKTKSISLDIKREVLDAFTHNDYRNEDRMYVKGLDPYRVGGYLRTMYGSIELPFQINSQDPATHLSIDETRKMGTIFMTTMADYLNDPQKSKAMSESVAAGRDAWKNRMEQYLATIDQRYKERALLTEWMCYMKERESKRPEEPAK